MSRSRRGASSSKHVVAESVRAGIRSLCEGNLKKVGAMLDRADGLESAAQGEDLLVDVMKVNSLNAEMLLGRFFDRDTLSEYCTKVLAKSGKGSEMVLASRIAAEWSKPSFLAKRTRQGDEQAIGDPQSSAAKKRKSVQKHRPDSSDWRYPLFFWKGVLSKAGVEDDKMGLQWQGRWVAQADNLPNPEAFETEGKDNHFSLKGTLDDGISDDVLESLTKLAGAGGSFIGSYQLDQGDGNGHQKFTDIEHSFRFASATCCEDSTLFIGARGSTEFGKFISLGVVERLGDPAGNKFQLVLARRYVTNIDPRAKLKTAKQVLDLRNQAKDSSESESKTPWEVL